MSLRKQSARLGQRLDAIPNEILAALRPTLVRAGNDVGQAMRELAETSRDTGALIDSITVTGPGETTPAYATGGGMRTAGPNEVLVTVGNEKVRYGHLVEFGTVKSEAKPFMLPAWRLLRARMERRIKSAITRAIKRAGAGQ